MKTDCSSNGPRRDPGAMYEAFSADNHMDVIERYIIGTQIFAKRFRKLQDAASSSPRGLVRRKSARNNSSSARMPPQSAQNHEGSILIREAKNEILYGDIDLGGLEQFLTSCREGQARIVHIRTTLPSRIGMSLYMSAFEDLMSMRTRAFLVKDIDPAILERLLGRRSLTTEMTNEQISDITPTKSQSRWTRTPCWRSWNTVGP